MNKEILVVAEAVSNEKGVEKDVIFQAIESALVMATKKKIPEDIGVRVTIDRKTGDYETVQYWTVVPDLTEEDELEFPHRDIPVSQAKERDASLEIGSEIIEPMPSVAFGRIAATAAKQVILQEVRKAERNQIIFAYEMRIGELVSGIVKKSNRECVIMDLGGNAEALVKRDQLIPRETIRVNERIRAYLLSVNPEPRGPQLLVSRTVPEMLIELFKIEVPEIGEDIIEIKAAARDPGSRAKIAVKTNDGRIDPIGACVGMRGARVQAVSNELNGERIDIILWDDNPAQLVINAMAPAEVSSIVVDEDTHTMDVAVAEEQLSQAIGRSGQNVRLASELTGWTLNIMTVSEANEKSEAETHSVLNTFMEGLGVDEEVAELLVSEGFSTVEEIAYVPVEELLDIEEFDEEIVEALRSSAKDYLLTKALMGDSAEGSQPAEDLLAMAGMTEAMANVLAKHDICTMEDLAEQAVDELLEIEALGVNEEQAAQLIMTARAPWFEE